VQASLVANAVEAVIGAILQDGGLAPARKFILTHWRVHLQAVESAPRDPKSALQEWAQGSGRPAPSYAHQGRSGPDHAPQFTSVVSVEGWPPASGVGASKQEAERAAARALLAAMAEAAP
jgi:ribonuclease-3